MKNLTIFSPFIYLENFVEMFNKVYSNNSFIINKTLNKLTLTIKSEKINLFVKNINNDTESITNMKKSMVKYYKSINTKNNLIRKHLIKKISQVNMVVSVLPLSNSEITKTILDEILKLTNAVDGIILIESEKILTSNGSLIFDSDGNTNLESPYF
jgi:23S rRNA maturation-related 3'-5' exoribonuclease YhaM